MLAQGGTARAHGDAWPRSQPDTPPAVMIACPLQRVGVWKRALPSLSARTEREERKKKEREAFNPRARSPARARADDFPLPVIAPALGPRPARAPTPSPLSLSPSMTHPHLHFSQKELREIERDTKSGVSVSLKSTGSGVGSDLTKLTGFVEGPRDTPYEGGYFVIDIELGKKSEREAGVRAPCACVCPPSFHPSQNLAPVSHHHASLSLLSPSPSHHHSIRRPVPLRPAPHAVRHESVAPQHLLRQWRHLPGHPPRRLVARADAEDGAAVAPVAARLARARRPAGRGRGQAVPGRP